MQKASEAESSVAEWQRTEIQKKKGNRNDSTP